MKLAFLDVHTIDPSGDLSWAGCASVVWSLLACSISENNSKKIEGTD
jgi:hypothetical protein